MIVWFVWPSPQCVDLASSTADFRTQIEHAPTQQPGWPVLCDEPEGLSAEFRGAGDASTSWHLQTSGYIIQCAVCRPYSKCEAAALSSLRVCVGSLSRSCATVPGCLGTGEPGRLPLLTQPSDVTCGSLVEGSSPDTETKVEKIIPQIHALKRTII